MTVPITPKDHAEAIALFRQSIVGALVCRELAYGELRAELVRLSQQRYRPPGARATRRYGFSTLERWYYALKKGGIDALRPAPRSDSGYAQALTDEQRTLILDIRRDHPSASASLILDTLVRQGRLDEGAVSISTLNRLFAANGLDRVAAADGRGPRTRLRWEAEGPDALWHGDVCHGPSLTIDGDSRPLRIHGLLDDASRYCVALVARHTEQQQDMLEIFADALRRHGRPGTLYLDNGSTYRGASLETVCGRLEVQLLHSRPYDPQARGKMERFWRTLRERCLRYLGSCASLHDVNARLLAFLDAYYHDRPHAGLMGRTPAEVYRTARARKRIANDALNDAFTLRTNHRVRTDTTVQIDGTVYQLEQGFLAGRRVTVARCLLDGGPAPVVEYEDQRFVLSPVDPKANARRKRTPRYPDRPEGTVSSSPPDFDPPSAVLEDAVGRTPNPTSYDTENH